MVMYDYLKLGEVLVWVYESVWDFEKIIGLCGMDVDDIWL